MHKSIQEYDTAEAILALLTLMVSSMNAKSVEDLQQLTSHNCN